MYHQILSKKFCPRNACHRSLCCNNLDWLDYLLCLSFRNSHCAFQWIGPVPGITFLYLCFSFSLWTDTFCQCLKTVVLWQPWVSLVLLSRYVGDALYNFTECMDEGNAIFCKWCQEMLLIFNDFTVFPVSESENRALCLPKLWKETH